MQPVSATAGQSEIPERTGGWGSGTCVLTQSSSNLLLQVKEPEFTVI